MEFKYHTYGSTWRSSTLQLVLVSGASYSREFWRETPSDFPNWRTARVTIPPQSSPYTNSKPALVVFSVGLFSDLGIDDVKIVEGSCDSVNLESLCTDAGLFVNPFLGF